MVSALNKKRILLAGVVFIAGLLIFSAHNPIRVQAQDNEEAPSGSEDSGATVGTPQIRDEEVDDEEEGEAAPAEEHEGGRKIKSAGVAGELDESESTVVGLHSNAASQKLTDAQGQPMTHETLVEELLRRMSSPDERTRLEAGIALRSVAKLSDVPTLVTVLKRGNNEDKQRFLVDTLGWLQDRRAGEALRFEIEHGDMASQRAAITALGELRFNWPIPVLARTLRKNKDDELRKRAASALGVIGTAQSVFALRSSLSDLEESPGGKNAAFWALEKARGEVDEEQIDDKMPRGRRLQLYYKGTRYFLYQPAVRKNAAANKEGLRPWMLVCIHDGDLRAEDLFNICWRAGKKRQMAVLVPYFDNIRFPEYGNFNIWGKSRADKRLLKLIEHVGKNAGVSTREFFLFGYGQGGDFVERFIMAYPKRIARAAFEADSFTMPDREQYFPRGLNRSPLAPDIDIDIYSFLKTDAMVILRKNSPTLREARSFYEAVTHWGDVEGVRSRVAVRTVDVKFDIWNEAEKYLFSYE